MATFSERNGYLEARSLIQLSDLDSDTRNSLWSATFSHLESLRTSNFSIQISLLKKFWTDHLFRPLDEFNGINEPLFIIKSIFQEKTFNEIFDFIEFWLRILNASSSYGASDRLELNLNSLLQKFLVGYRLNHGIAIPIDNEISIDSIDEALLLTSGIPGANSSLSKALKLLSDRDNPDYANSIKESVSAVEAVVLKLTGTKTLSEGLKKLEGQGLEVHEALRIAWIKLYAWASDENGIRHGSIDVSKTDQSLAKYMLVSCSAFVTYLLDESRLLTNEIT